MDSLGNKVQVVDGSFASCVFWPSFFYSSEGGATKTNKASTETTQVFSHLALNNAPPAGRKYLLCPFEVGLRLTLSGSLIIVACLLDLHACLPFHHPPTTTNNNCRPSSHQTAAAVLPKAEQLLRSSVQPYISSILEALMEPTSRGFSEVRDVFFKELVEVSRNSLNGGGNEKLGEVSHSTHSLPGHVRVQVGLHHYSKGISCKLDEY